MKIMPNKAIKYCKRCGSVIANSGPSGRRKYCGFKCSNAHHDFVAMGHATEGIKRKHVDSDHYRNIGLIGGIASAKKQAVMNRSKGENFLAVLLRRAGLNVRQSVWDLVDGYEIDIFLPDRNVAISYNGPVHYKPIYGEKRLRQVRSRDRYRSRKLKELGVRHIIIKEFRRFRESISQEHFSTVLASI